MNAELARFEHDEARCRGEDVVEPQAPVEALPVEVAAAAVSAAAVGVGAQG